MFYIYLTLFRQNLTKLSFEFWDGVRIHKYRGGVPKTIYAISASTIIEKVDPSAEFFIQFRLASKNSAENPASHIFSAEFQLTNLWLILRLAEFFKSQQHSCTCVCSVIHKGKFLCENIDTNKMYVCIFKHSFLKWTVVEKITVSHKCKIIDKLHRPYCLTAPLGVTWSHRSRDYLIAHMPFPIGGPLERSL